MVSAHHPPFHTVTLEAVWPYGHEAWKDNALVLGKGQVPVWRSTIVPDEREPYENVVPLAPNEAFLDRIRLVMS